MYRQQAQQQAQQSENMQRDPSLIQFNDLSTLSQKKFERARSKYLLDKLTGKLNNPDYFLQLTRSMAELNGTDTDQFLSTLYAQAKEKKEAADLAALKDGSESMQDTHRIQLMERQSKQLEALTSDVQEADIEKTSPIGQQKKQWSELDKYIELLLDSKQTDQSVFVYLNPSPDGNPYDLQISQYHDRNE